MIYAGLLAAGIGARMHRQDIPKPFLALGEKPILIHTAEQFFANPSVGRVIVVAPGDWTQYTQDLLDAHGSMGKEYFVIPGGMNKTESVNMVVQYVGETWGIAEGDILVIHDAIRPFITQRVINDNIDAANGCGAANTVMKTNDTIIVSAGGEMLESVPPHENVYAQQTPQTYELTRLKAAIDRAVAGGEVLAGETELPRLYIRMGNEMRLVRGEYSNMKIINPYDLEVANALLKERKHD